MDKRPLNGPSSVKRPRGEWTREKPKFKVPLSDQWSLVFTNKGRRFFYDSKQRKSFWEIPEDNKATDVVKSALESIDKTEMILLVAKARGLKISSSLGLGNDSEPKLVQKDHEEEIPQGSKEGFKEEPETTNESTNDLQDDSNVDDRSFSVVDGPALPDHEVDVNKYAAELEADSDSNLEQQQQQPPNSEPNSDSDEVVEDAFNIEDFEDSESEEDDQSLIPNDVVAEFELMLEEHQINPYGIWESEREKLVNDDRYDLYDMDKRRQDAFNEWARKKAQVQAELEPGSGPGSGSESEEDHLSDPVIAFLLFVQKSHNPKHFYIDFKRKHRKDAEFADSDLPDKDKEKLYREYHVVSKKSEQDRYNLLLQRLQTVKNYRYEPVFYTLSTELQTKALEATGTTKKKSVNEILEQRKQSVEEERCRTRKMLHGSRKKLKHKIMQLKEANENLDSLRSLKDML